MKKCFAVFMALLLILLTLCACGSPEKMLENIIEKQTGQSIDIQDDGGSITIKGDDGESMTVTSGDNQEWPAGKMGDLPELKGKVVSVVEADGTCYVSLEGVSESDAKAYIEKLKDMGYVGGEYSGEDGAIAFSGTNGDHQVALNYYPEGGSSAGMSSVSIVYALSAE